MRIFGCGNQLPWVNAGKHLGMKLENKPGSIVKQDMKEKRAQYIQRNNELMQEFSYANSTTKTKINSIYNSHFTGSVLWDLFGHEAQMIYNTWNSSIRNMFRLDRTTHRYLIEPVSRTPHIKISLLKRFMNFTNKLMCSRKTVAKNLFKIIRHDCRRTTGRNLRKIIRHDCRRTTGRNLRKTMHYCGKIKISEITSKDIGKELPSHSGSGDMEIGSCHNLVIIGLWCSG